MKKEKNKIMSKYFTVRVTPDVINGDVSTVVGDAVHVSDSGDAPFANKDILFDWTSFDIPKGAARLVSVSAYVMGEDGGEQVVGDIHLVFATAKNGEAPTTLGAVNSPQTTGFDLPDHILGGFKLEGSTGGQGTIQGPAFGNVYIASPNSANGSVQTLVLEGDPNTGTNVGFDKIYVAGFAGGQIDFSTGVKPTAQATTSTATIAVDGVDPRKCFQVGDTVYTNTDDTALGTVKSMTSSAIVLNANLAAQVEDNEEIVNANPIKLVLGFEK